MQIHIYDESYRSKQTLLVLIIIKASESKKNEYESSHFFK